MKLSSNPQLVFALKAMGAAMNETYWADSGFKHYERGEKQRAGMKRALRAAVRAALEWEPEEIEEEMPCPDCEGGGVGIAIRKTFGLIQSVRCPRCEGCGTVIRRIPKAKE